MSDVRLVATNPEDSSLVPVACTPAGLIKTEVGTIEEVPNDLLISGNLTVTGTVSGPDGEIVGQPGPEGPDGPEGPPGPNVLLPYGPEDSVLIVKNGAPVWSTDWQPPPPPEPPAHPCMLVDERNELGRNNEFGIYADSEQKITPPETWDAFARTTDAWATPSDSRTGVSAGRDGGAVNFVFKLNLTEGSFNHILTMRCVTSVSTTGEVPGSMDMSISLDTADGTLSGLSPINTSTKKDNHFFNGSFRLAADFSYLITRDSVGEVGFRLLGTRSAANNNNSKWNMDWGVCQSWKIEPASLYLLRRLSEVDPTLDIDPLRSN